MKKRLLIGGVIVILAIVVFTVVVIDDADHYDYDWDRYEGMHIKVKTVDAFVIKVNSDTIVIVSILNRGERSEGLISQTVVKRKGVWSSHLYPARIVPRIYTSSWLLDDEELKHITDVIGNESYSGRSSITLSSTDALRALAISKIL